MSKKICSVGPFFASLLDARALFLHEISRHENCKKWNQTKGQTTKTHRITTVFYFAMMFLLKGACKDCYPTERATIAHARPCSSDGRGDPDWQIHRMPRLTNKSKLSSHHSTTARNKCSIPAQAVQYLHTHGDTSPNPRADCWHAKWSATVATKGMTWPLTLTFGQHWPLAVEEWSLQYVSHLKDPWRKKGWLWAKCSSLLTLPNFHKLLFDFPFLPNDHGRRQCKR